MGHCRCAWIKNRSFIIINKITTVCSHENAKTFFFLKSPDPNSVFFFPFNNSFTHLRTFYRISAIITAEHNNKLFSTSEGMALLVKEKKKSEGLFNRKMGTTKFFNL